MGKIITGVEFAILVAIVVGIAILLHVMEARRSINALRKEDDDEQAKRDAAARRRMLHEADSKPCADLEPFCGAGDAHATAEQEMRAKAEADRKANSRQAIRRTQQAAWNAQRTLEKERQAERIQHNSSFRAMGMTPIPLPNILFWETTWSEAMEKDWENRRLEIECQVLDAQRVELDKMMASKP